MYHYVISVVFVLQLRYKGLKLCYTALAESLDSLFVTRSNPHQPHRIYSGASADLDLQSSFGSSLKSPPLKPYGFAFLDA